MLPLQRREPGRWRWACAAIAAAGFALRVGIALREIDVVDRLFVPDDTYYTLSVARSLAHGLGPVVDGTKLTNGFQPLLAFLLVPAFRFATSADAPLRAAWLLMGACDAVTAFVLGELARRVGGERGLRAAILATAMWAASPFAIAYALGGLETSLALLVVLATVLAWDHALAVGRLPAFAAAGALAGLALLARVDAAFVVAALGAASLWRRQWQGLLVGVVATTCVVLPWWSYEFAHFGSVIPESGAAVLEQVRYHQLVHLAVPQQVAFAVGTVCEPFFARALELRDVFWNTPALAFVAAPCLAAALAYTAARLVPARHLAVRAYLLTIPVYVAFYALYLPAIWFFPRYLAPVHLAITLVVALGLAHAFADRRALVRGAAWGLALAEIAVSVGSSGWYALRAPDQTLDKGLHGAKGYREPARQILAAAPDHAVIGALQSGALGYYAAERGACVRVVNLDGVVDRDAASAFREGALVAFARSRGMTHLADWPFNVEAFGARAGDPTWSEARLRRVGVARPQGGDRFNLYEILW